MKRLVLLLPRLVGALVVGLVGGLVGGCALFPGTGGHAQWHATVFPSVSYDDVFDISVLQLDRDYAIRSANRGDGSIETSWDYDSVSEFSRMLQREQVVCEVDSVDDGVLLKLRVRTQVKERTGLLAPDDVSDEGWEEARDNVDRATVLFQRIHSSLVKGRPSDDFYERPPLFDEEHSDDVDVTGPR